ncbi:MAG: Clp protease ClpP [Clostridia bacterium]
MREINLNGYIDDEVWFGDEITPETLHDSLYGMPDAPFTDDVHIRLNSYGGSCNAATRMYDDIRAYVGSVHITVSGTAASAATVLSMAATKLDMTPGSLFMIHDPSTVAWGNESDLAGAIDLLHACKESILNVYGKRCKRKREDTAAMMSATTWMDAQAALENGFIDGIVEDEPSANPTNAAQLRTVSLKEAKLKVQAWFDRHTPHNPQLSRPVQSEGRLPDKDQPSVVTPAHEQALMSVGTDGTAQQEDTPSLAASSAQPPITAETQRMESAAPQEAPANLPETNGSQTPTGTPIAQLQKRLGLLMPSHRQ